MLEPAGDDPVARPPVDRPDRDVELLGRRMPQGDRARPDPADGGHARSGFVHPLEELEPVVFGRASDPELPVGQLGHHPMRLGRERPDRAGIQVDPGRGRRQGVADGGQLVAVGEEGGHHGSV
jgi:hypothetical protein